MNKEARNFELNFSRPSSITKTGGGRQLRMTTRPFNPKRCLWKTWRRSRYWC